MNERIRELGQQLGMTDSEGKFYSPNYEILAEAIVKDCVNMIEGMSPGYHDYRDQIEDAFREDCVRVLKQRFGVES
jgi:hypothetical protein